MRAILTTVFGLLLVPFVMACSADTDFGASNGTTEPLTPPTVTTTTLPVDLCENLSCPTCQTCDAGVCVALPNCKTACVVAPEVVGMVAPFARGNTNDVVVAGNYLYAATTLGLQIYDNSDPAAPQELSWLTIDAPAKTVRIEDQRAYVAAGESGLWIIDVEDPTTPSVMMQVAVDGSAEGVAVSDTVLIVAAGEAGLVFVDKASGETLGFLETEYSVTGVTLHDGLVYVGGQTELLIVDPTDPVEPALIASVELQTTSPAYVYAVTVVGDRAYVALSSQGVHVLDISDPANPTALGSHNGRAKDVAATPDGVAFVVGSGLGFTVVDFSDPANPEVLTSLKEVKSLKVHLADNVVYGTGSGLIGLDVTSLEAPEVLFELKAHGSAQGVTVVGDLAYVADSTGGMKIFDLSVPENPVELSAITGFTPAAVDVVGDYAYAVSKRKQNCWCTPGGLDIVDVSDPGNPVAVGTLDFSGFPNSVQVVDGIAWIGTTYGGGIVVDVTDPKAPKSLTHVTPSMSFSKTQIVGNYLFAVHRYRGLAVYDISDPSAPKQVAEVETPGHAADLALDGDTVYIADENGGLQIIDVSTPASPTTIASVNTPSPVSRVAVRDGMAYLSQAGGVRLVDVSEPSAPQMMGLIDVVGGVSGIFAGSEFAFVTGGANLLTVIDLGCGK